MLDASVDLLVGQGRGRSRGFRRGSRPRRTPGRARRSRGAESPGWSAWASGSGRRRTR